MQTNTTEDSLISGSCLSEDDLETNKTTMFFSYDKGFIAKVILESKEIVRRDRFMKFYIKRIVASSSRTELICADEKGNVSVFSIRDHNYGNCIYDFGRIHRSTIYGLEITKDDEYIYTSSLDKRLVKTS